MKSGKIRASISMLLAAFLAAPQSRAEEIANLRVLVVHGEGGVNQVINKRTVPVEVEVKDERSRPVEGAKVRFTLPSLGPGGRFADGSRSAEAFTDARGRAAIASFVPNEQEGRFSIVVDATSKGREASAVVSQNNARYLVPAASSRAYQLTSSQRRGNRTLAIVLGVGAAAAVGGVLAIKGGGGAPVGAVAGPVGVSVGGVTVGGPQ